MTPLRLRVIADDLNGRAVVHVAAIREAADDMERMRRRIDELEEFCRGVATNCRRIAGEPS